MVILAVLPGPAVLVLVSRTLSGGTWAGVITTIGILCADFVLILLAIYGLSSLSIVLGELFVVIKYIGGIYLLWLGIKIFYSINKQETIKPIKTNYSTHFIAGFITTLSNPKAILFYISFFPTFINIKFINYIDLSIILLITIFAIGGTLMSYVYISIKTGSTLKNNKFTKLIKLSAGLALVGSGLYVASRS